MKHTPSHPHYLSSSRLTHGGEVEDRGGDQPERDQGVLFADRALAEVTEVHAATNGRGMATSSRTLAMTCSASPAP